jgi:hypothetical protein
MSDESNTIMSALDSGDVKALNEKWYTKVSETHIGMFVLLEHLGILLAVDGDEAEKKQHRRLLTHECTLTGLDCYISTTGASYTEIIDEVRKNFGGLARGIERLRFFAVSRGQAEIVKVMDALHEVSCAEANADCFKSLINGYRRSVGIKCDDDNS